MKMNRVWHSSQGGADLGPWPARLFMCTAIAALGACSTTGEISLPGGDSRSPGDTNDIGPQATLEVSAHSVTFTGAAGEPAPASQTVTISNSGDAALEMPTSSIAYSSGTNWLNATISGSSEPYHLTIAVTPTGMSAGNYEATVSVASSGTSNGPRPIAVSLNLAGPPSLQLSASSLSLTAAVGGNDPASQTLTVTNSGGGVFVSPTASVTYTSGSGWLSANVTGTAAPYLVTVAASVGALAVGTYEALLTLASASASNSPQSVAVTFTVTTAPSLAVSTTSLSFDGLTGTAPPMQTVMVTNAGGGTLPAPIPSIAYGSGAGWLTAAVSGATSPYTVTIQPSATGLSAGTYEAAVTLTSTGVAGSPKTVAVTFEVVAAPEIGFSTNDLEFSAVSYSVPPPAQTVTVTNASAIALAQPTLSVSYEQGDNWLTGAIEASGDDYTVTLQPNPRDLASGSYTAKMFVESANAANSPQVITVTLTLAASWTVFVYGHADHNLSQSLVVDMLEMDDSTPGHNVRVVVAADWSAGRQASDGSYYPDGTEWYLIDGSSQSLDPFATSPEQNFDSPAVIRDSVAYAFSNFPADRYGVVLWDHGGSWIGGFGYDENNTPGNGSDDSYGISAANVAAAVSDGLVDAGIGGIRPLDFVAFDTCLMMGNEVTYEFTDVAEVYLAAAELDFGDGWDYEATFSWLRNNADATAKQVGIAEVDHWDAHHATAGSTDILVRAHAAFDMTAMDAYAGAWSALSSSLLQSSSIDWLEVARSGFLAQPGYYTESVMGVDPQPSLRDAGQLLDELSLVTSDIAVAAAAVTTLGELYDSILNSSLGVIRLAAGQVGVHSEAALGPVWTPRSSAYESLAWNAATNWGGILDAIGANADQSAPTLTTTAYNTDDPDATYPPWLEFDAVDADVAEAYVQLGETYLGTTYLYGVIGAGNVTPESSYSFVWDGNIFALDDGTDASRVYLHPWIQGTASALYVLPAYLSDSINTILVYAVHEDGDNVVTRLLAETAGGIDVMNLVDLSGLTFTPLLYDATEETWVESYPLIIPQSGSLAFETFAAPVGLYHLYTKMSDVWGNLAAVVDDVDVLTPFGN